MQACDECHFSYDSEDRSSIPDRLRTLGGRYRAPLTRFLPGEDGVALLRSHPVDGGWSALEYACHVRDVLTVQLDRLALAQAQPTPTFEPMRREERVTELRYDEQDPTAVADDVLRNAGVLASAFGALDPDGWERTGIYAYPEPAERSMLWVGQHTVHELHHHLLDVGRVLRAARGR